MRTGLNCIPVSLVGLQSSVGGSTAASNKDMRERTFVPVWSDKRDPDVRCADPGTDGEHAVGAAESGEGRRISVGAAAGGVFVWSSW